MENELFLKPLPQILAKIISSYKWQQNLTGCSASQVFRLERENCESFYLKVAQRERSDLPEEKHRLEWLNGKLPVPEVRFFARDDESDYLLLSEIKGAAASADLWQNRPQKIVEQLAAGLQLIHSLPIQDCPFDETLNRKIEAARRNVELNLIDETDFDDERLGRTAADLFVELLATRPATEELVFTHGDYCLPNVILKDLHLSGFIDLGRAGIADKYQDVALLARSVESNFGAHWLPFFFEITGIEPDQQKLDFYKLLDEFF